MCKQVTVKAKCGFCTQERIILSDGPHLVKCAAKALQERGFAVHPDGFYNDDSCPGVEEQTLWNRETAKAHDCTRHGHTSHDMTAPVGFTSVDPSNEPNAAVSNHSSLWQSPSPAAQAPADPGSGVGPPPGSSPGPAPAPPATSCRVEIPSAVAGRPRRMIDLVLNGNLDIEHVDPQGSQLPEGMKWEGWPAALPSDDAGQKQASPPPVSQPQHLGQTVPHYPTGQQNDPGIGTQPRPTSSFASLAGAYPPGQMCFMGRATPHPVVNPHQGYPSSVPGNLAPSAAHHGGLSSHTDQPAQATPGQPNLCDLLTPTNPAYGAHPVGSYYDHNNAPLYNNIDLTSLSGLAGHGEDPGFSALLQGYTNPTIQTQASPCPDDPVLDLTQTWASVATNQGYYHQLAGDPNNPGNGGDQTFNGSNPQPEGPAQPNPWTGL